MTRSTLAAVLVSEPEPLTSAPGLWPVVGIGFVVAAGIGAERTGARAQAIGAPAGTPAVPATLER